MISAASEKSRRFDTEVSDLLLMAVDLGPSVPLDDTEIFFFYRLLFLFRLVLPDFRLLSFIKDKTLPLAKKYTKN